MGPSYAAVTVTGKSVKDRSLEGRDIKRDSLSGTEVRESTLGRVAKAQTADRATTAGQADQATRAAKADDAAAVGGQAASAFLPANGKAQDAEQVDGAHAAQLLRTGVVSTVVADTTIANQAVYTDTLLGFKLQTNEDTTADPDLYVTHAATESRSLRVMRSASSVLLPAGINALTTAITNDKPTLVIADEDPSLMAQISCAKDYSAGSGRVVCMAIHSKN